MHVEGRLAHVLELVRLRHGRVDLALRDESVGLEGLAVVREVAGDDPLEVHPEVAVVVLVHEARGRRAGRDRAALAGDVDRRAEGLATGVLEDDVDVLAAGQLTDLLAQALPLLGVLPGAVLVPELPVLLGTVDDVLGAHAAHDLGLLLVGDDADRVGATVERVLRGEAAEPSGRAPDQDVVALLHVAAVLGHELAVGRRVDEAGGRGLLPREVVRLRQELVGLHERDVGEAAEVRLEAPDALLRVHHRVVVARRVLELDRQTVRHDLGARLPLRDAGTRAQHDAGEVGADHVVGQVVALGERRQLAVALEEAEGRDGLEDRRPDGVVVDGAGHDGDERLARAQLGQGHVLDVDRLARVLVAAGDALEHVHLVLVDGGGGVVVGDLQVGEVLARRVSGEDRIEDVLHGASSGGCSGARSGTGFGDVTET